VPEQLLDVTLYQLAALGELVTRAVLQVLAQTARLGLARAAGQVAVLHQIRQPRVDRLGVEHHALRGQPLRHLRRGLVGQQARDLAGERAHDGDVARRLLVDRIAQRLEPYPLEMGETTPSIDHGARVASGTDDPGTCKAGDPTSGSARRHGREPLQLVFVHHRGPALHAHDVRAADRE
jgi:hypothetical protein